MKEVTINNLNRRKQKQKEIEKQALDCLACKKIEIKSVDNLSEEIFSQSKNFYINPTEELMMGSIVKENDKVATVLGSGDFAIDASFHGAKEILTFDINKLQLFPANLKLIGLQNMNYEDYWNFFSNEKSDDYLSPKVYEKLKRNSSHNTNIFPFFDIIMDRRIIEKRRMQKYIEARPDISIFIELLKSLKSDDVKKRKAAEELFKKSKLDLNLDVCEVDFDLLFRMLDPYYEKSRVFNCMVGYAGNKTKNSYLESEDSYNKAKEKIKDIDIKFIKSDISKLYTNLSKTDYINSNNSGFNSIYLSNVPEYIKGDVFSKIVDEQLMPLLEKGGQIVYCCQGTNIESLKMASDELENLKQNASINFNIYQNGYFEDYQKINNIEGYQRLCEKYDIELKDAKKLSNLNGVDEKGVFVYIKK